MKFKAPWFMDGKEVDLPDMKVEGTLAVAELTKKYADEFIPFITTLQEEAVLRARVTELTEILLVEKNLTADQIKAAKLLLRLYNKEPAEAPEELIKRCNTLFPELNSQLIKYQQQAARNSILTSPFFLLRSLHEAYYMIKAYIWEEARKKNEKPKMPFTLDELQTLISDPELALFAKYSMERIKNSVTIEGEEPKKDTPEEVKKK